MSLIYRLSALLVPCVFFIGAASVTIHPFGSVRKQNEALPILSGATIDVSTKMLLERACQNCHSERTRWPWYSHVAPASWLIESDVSAGRAHLNLSRWNEYTVSEREVLLSAIGAAVRSRQMPPERFVLLHPEAVLTAEEQSQIYRWAHAERRRERSPVQHSSFIAQER